MGGSLYQSRTRSNLYESVRQSRRFTILNYYGYKSEFVNRLGLDRLKLLLSNNILVVLIIEPIKGKSNTHAVLAVGYNDLTDLLLIEDPSNIKKAYTYAEINDYWKAGIGNPVGYTVNAGFIIYPKE